MAEDLVCMMVYTIYCIMFSLVVYGCQATLNLAAQLHLKASSHRTERQQQTLRRISVLRLSVGACFSRLNMLNRI